MKYADIDRAPEEKARGITINACHIGYSTTTRDFAHTDCPGHIDYIKNMIVGTSQMDAAVLVVAATDGTMPQTHEHLMLAKQIGLKNIIVYINKVDLVDDQTVELVQIETVELLQHLGFESSKVPIVIGSALCALENKDPEIGEQSIRKLLDALDHIPLPERKRSGPFVMPVEKVITVAGRGTVLIGTISEGTLNRSDPAVIQGYGQEFKTIVSSIRMFENFIDKAEAGDNVGLLVRGIKKEVVRRGMYVSHQNAGVTQHDAVQAHIYVRTKAEGGRTKPITNKYIQTMYMDTWDLASCIMLPSGLNLVMPGESIETDIILRTPMVVRKGQQFFIREGKNTTVSGVVTKLLPPTEVMLSGFNRLRQATVAIESNAQVVQKKKFEKLAKETKRKASKHKK